ncbi:hypothetical protein B0H65DRAFT_123880 [Neurospora tetraspora]|uniref:Uncharacterized protein n=1 Tax=Neurospora tetraspora TaxID=94610 RepID=A0AAE0JLA8_9PEZI|nr:hypothetical protein B0H65DRAFT_123880 [Neurospora tetraspora]
MASWNTGCIRNIFFFLSFCSSPVLPTHAASFDSAKLHHDGNGWSLLGTLFELIGNPNAIHLHDEGYFRVPYASYPFFPPASSRGSEFGVFSFEMLPLTVITRSPEGTL